MMTKNRTLLVVEDNRDLNLQYKMSCRLALQELGFSAQAAKDAVKQAFNLAGARDVLQEYAVDFISIDIALTKEEERLTGEAREVVEPGGMALLRELQEYEKQPISIIVTGEEVDDYVLDAWRKYGVLTYYKKGSFDVDKEYKSAVKAALWYWDAEEAIADPETELDIEQAERSWRKALDAGKQAGVTERDFPESIGYKIKLTRENRTHSATGLPIDRWTHGKLKRAVLGRQDWALIRVTIQGFDEFVRVYPSQEEPVLAFVASLLKGARDAFNDPELFIGHLGYHKNAPFVVLLGQEDLRRVEDVDRWTKDIKRRFAEQAPSFVSAFGGQEPALALETKVWVGASERMFTDLHQLLDVLGST
jgi:DNA-binding NarL/FixJ family response regulator